MGCGWGCVAHRRGPPDLISTIYQTMKTNNKRSRQGTRCDRRGFLLRITSPHWHQVWTEFLPVPFEAVKTLLLQFEVIFHVSTRAEGLRGPSRGGRIGQHPGSVFNWRAKVTHAVTFIWHLNYSPLKWNCKRKGLWKDLCSFKAVHRTDGRN